MIDLKLPVAGADARLSRRSLLVSAAAGSFLAACGGGGGSGGAPLPPQRGSFTRLASAFAASEHTASLTPAGHVVLVGGSRAEPTLSSAINRFDPAAGTFTRIGDMDAGRAAHAATVLPSGAILVTGGLRSSGSPRAAELVDPATGAVRFAGEMSVGRIGHSALKLPDGRVLLAGGFSTGERAPLGISDSADIWDPGTLTFRRLGARMSIARASHSATLLPGGKVLLAGGYTWAGTYVFAELFDPATETFTPLTYAGSLRANHAAHLLPDGRVLIAGGESVSADLQSLAPLDSVLAYTPSGGTWRELSPLRSPRTLAASVLLTSGELVLFGGQSRPTGYVATVEAYAPASGGAAIAPLDVDRALHTATLLPSGRVLVAGGEATGGALCTTAGVYEP